MLPNSLCDGTFKRRGLPMETPKHDRPWPVLMVTLHNLMVAEDNTYYVIKHRDMPQKKLQL